MARLVGRSRGCKSCLQRRIKCDEKLPECTQCVSRRAKCPGATVGAVFVTMEPKKKKAKPKGGKDSNSQTKPIKATDSAKSNCSRCSLKPVKSATPKSHMDLQFVLPTTYQPSKTAQFEQLFLSHFVSEFDHKKLQGLPTGSWYDHLPSIYSSTPYESCKESIRSTTMLHYGVMTKNQSIQTEAYRWYSKALESQRMFLRIDPLPPGQTMPAAEEALTAVILGMFELVSSTTPTGWINHFMGAASILQMRKPENCQTGLAHLVFRAMRPTTVCTTISTKQPHPFASHPWDSVPFEVYPKTTYDRLVDILLLLPSCLALEDQINRITGLDSTAEQNMLLELELLAFSLQKRLDDWWLEYVEVQSRNGESAGLFGQPRYTSTTREPYFPDASSSATTSSYHAARIILYTILLFCSGEESAYDTEIELHSGLILASCSYMIAKSTPSAGTLMMVFPLKIMCLSSRNKLQKQAAFDILAQWGEKKGTLGICTQASTLYGLP